jgi:ribA/ribD-fused uncharacterized protein
MGKRIKGKNVPRPIKILFETHRDRNKVWKSKSLLKGTKLFIKEDLPKDIEKETATLLPIYNAAKAAGYKCGLNRNKLYINGELFDCDTLSRLPDGLKPTAIATKTTEKELFFWGRHTPFSNMYSCKISEEDITYTSAEQMYVTKKARFFGDKNAESKILQSSDPIQQKKTFIRGYNSKEWETVAEDCMCKCIRAKFVQNAELRKILIESYPKILVEASPHDAIWGIGIGMYNPSIEDKHKWGKNLTGKIFMNVRDSLRDVDS